MIEIDFLWVGAETKTGDAITCRFTDPVSGENVIMVIDGGFLADGARIVKHVGDYYGTHVIDLVVCTHPDDDHIRGLFDVIDLAQVKRLLIHDPARYGYRGDAVKAPLVADLIAAAAAAGTIVDYSFTGTTYFGGAVTIAGPTEDYYRTLLADQTTTSQSAHASLFTKAAAAIMRVLRTLTADPGETLSTDNGGTTPRNNSSIVVHLDADGYQALFTGDAGVPALNNALDYLEQAGIPLAFDFVQVPHHGSRHNLDQATADRLLGLRSDDPPARGEALVSVGKEADDFPRPEVANAFKRRGYAVSATRGTNLWWHRNAPERANYGPVQPLGWLEE